MTIILYLLFMFLLFKFLYSMLSFCIQHVVGCLVKYFYLNFVLIL